MAKRKIERWQCDSCHTSVNVKASSPYIPYCDDCEQDRYLAGIYTPEKRTRFTPSSLKALYEAGATNTESKLYFDRKTMEYTGDTMRNYGVRKVQVTGSDGPDPAWELYRIKPVNFGETRSDFFGLDGQHLVAARLHSE